MIKTIGASNRGQYGLCEGHAASTLALEDQIVYCGRKIGTIHRHETRGALSVCEFRLSLRDKNRPGAFRRRPGRAKFALLLW